MDLEAVDPDYYKALAWMLHNDITDVLDLTFTAETDFFGRKVRRAHGAAGAGDVYGGGCLMARTALERLWMDKDGVASPAENDLLEGFSCSLPRVRSRPLPPARARPALLPKHAAARPWFSHAMHPVIAGPVCLLAVCSTRCACTTPSQELVELVPGGKDMRVTESNKREYVNLVARHRMTTSITQQINAFLEGFWQLVPRHLIAIFNDHELELLIRCVAG